MPHFSKPPYTLEQSIILLKERGLIIENENEAKFFLSRINYFRLSGYFFHLQEKSLSSNYNNFNEGTTFKDIEKLYIFDQKLRILLFEAIERIETFFCTILNEEMCKISTNSHWYIDTQFYKNETYSPSKFSKMIESKMADPHFHKPIFIEEYLNKEYEPNLPPSWMIMEILSLGESLNLFRKLKPKYQRKISKYFDLSETEFSNMFQILRFLRNMIAHHSRIWNNSIKYKFNGNNQYIKNDTSYQTGVKVILFLFSKIGFNSSWNSNLIELLNEYEIENIEDINKLNISLFPEKK